MSKFPGFTKTELREIANEWQSNWEQGKNRELTAWKGYVKIKNYLKEMDTIPQDLKIELGIQARLEEAGEVA